MPCQTDSTRIIPLAGPVRPPGPFHRLIQAASDLLFPRQCASCRRPLPHSARGYLCRECAARVNLILPPRCPRCATPLGPYVEAHPRCLACSGADLRFRGTIASCRYEGPLREAIHTFKYRGADFLARPFAELMWNALATADFLSKLTTIIPVPIYWRKHIQRGYNQAELLAHCLSKRAGLPAEPRVLLRVRDTPSQTALSRTQRMQNLLDAFAVRQPDRVKGRTLLLCDDVMTTGATASECARALLAAGAKAVYVCVVAR